MEIDRAGNNGSSLQRQRSLHGRTSGPTRRSTKGQWTAEEDETLRAAVHRYKGKNWKKIANCFTDRTDVQCLHRWQKVLNPDLVKGPWSKEEDDKIIELVAKYGPKKWSTIAQHLPGRIGKQCRERWHNHLNPNINREAWTQAEEIVLIQVHQMYGNKWAELSKFLPGRTDNAIKNHWNSSVKKKLDMYVNSGLLSKFPDLTLPIPQDHAAASSSSKGKQSSEDDVIEGGVEVEEASECSQGSTIPSMSQSTNNTTSLLIGAEDASLMPYSEDYRPVFQESAFIIPEVPCEHAADKFLEHDFAIDWGILEGGEWQQNPNEIPDGSFLHIEQESAGMFWPTSSDQGSHEAVVSFQQEPPMQSDKLNIIADPDFCPSEIDIQNMGHHTSTFPIPHDGTCTEILGSFFSQPGPFTNADGSLVFSAYQNLFHQELIPPTAHDGFIETRESDCSPGKEDSKDSRKLVPANDFVSDPSHDSQSSSSPEKGIKPDEPDSGTLCYEPPRFPSLDIPFFSCDLIQSGSDMQQEYSPLGIRQLMLSSLTPFKMWDSPCRDNNNNNSPDVVLKTAAKTFTGTPSILKKRHRDLVSPLSERRSEKKKPESCLRQEAYSNLANDISRLEVMFDECIDMKGLLTLPSSPTSQRNSEESCTGKENAAIGSVHQGEDCNTIFGNTLLKEEANDKTNNRGDSIELGKDVSGVLIEHDTNDLLFFSPDQFGVKTDSSVKNYQQIDSASKRGASLPSSESYISVVCSPRLTAAKDGANFVITTSLQTSTTPSNKKDKKLGKGIVAPENSNIFVETPFRRSIESPSAWKSPWFFDSFVPGSRVDTDITIEDIGYFLSPGDRSYDAIGLMKQLGEQTAGTFADAQEVLGNETPDSLMKAKSLMLMDAEKENNDGSPNTTHMQEHPSLSASNVMRERRTLDFSECGSPPPVKESKKYSSNYTLSSASSYLLKSCR